MRGPPTAPSRIEKTFVMAGLEPATQRPRVRAANRLRLNRGLHAWQIESLRLADARRLGGRLKAGHDEEGKA